MIIVIKIMIDSLLKIELKNYSLPIDPPLTYKASPYLDDNQPFVWLIIVHFIYSHNLMHFILL